MNHDIVTPLCSNFKMYLSTAPMINVQCIDQCIVRCTSITCGLAVYNPSNQQCMVNTDIGPNPIRLAQYWLHSADKNDLLVKKLGL